MNPDMLIIDEPSMGLAPSLVKDIAAAINKLEEKISLIVADQNLTFILSIADRIYIMDGGRIKRSGTKCRESKRRNREISRVINLSDTDENSAMKLAFASKDALLEDTEAGAHRFEQEYHGCAQCALAALMDTFPQIRNPEAFRAASGLGGGVGLSTEGTCGALAGGVLAIGLFFGRELEAFGDPESKRFTAYRLAKRLQDRFAAEYGSGICAGIQQQVMGRSYPLYDPEAFKIFVQDGGHSHKCPQVVGRGARWAAEILLEELEAAGTDLEFSP
ncbi:MAG: C-GCAxxG-C-C family protein [Desulfobacteraceae bacterium]|nr:C-GCAxxG-C-C family protein [Desulfobacteraceae bacterium]